MGESETLELTVKEATFLSSMTSLPSEMRELGPREEVKRYQQSKDKYHCDPCEACGPDACYSDNSGFLN